MAALILLLLVITSIVFGVGYVITDKRVFYWVALAATIPFMTLGTITYEQIREDLCNDRGGVWISQDTQCNMEIQR